VHGFILHVRDISDQCNPPQDERPAPPPAPASWPFASPGAAIRPGPHTPPTASSSPRCCRPTGCSSCWCCQPHARPAHSATCQRGRGVCLATRARGTGPGCVTTRTRINTAAKAGTGTSSSADIAARSGTVTRTGATSCAWVRANSRTAGSGGGEFPTASHRRDDRAAITGARYNHTLTRSVTGISVLVSAFRRSLNLTVITLGPFASLVLQRSTPVAAWPPCRCSRLHMEQPPQAFRRHQRSRPTFAFSLKYFRLAMSLWTIFSDMHSLALIAFKRLCFLCRAFECLFSNSLSKNLGDGCSPRCAQLQPRRRNFFHCSCLPQARLCRTCSHNVFLRCEAYMTL